MVADMRPADVNVVPFDREEPPSTFWGPGPVRKQRAAGGGRGAGGSHAESDSGDSDTAEAGTSSDGTADSEVSSESEASGESEAFTCSCVQQN